MSRARKLVEGALKKLDEASARADATAVAKLSAAERERYEYWQARSAAALNPDGSLAELEDAKLVGAAAPLVGVIALVLGVPAGMWWRAGRLERA